MSTSIACKGTGRKTAVIDVTSPDEWILINLSGCLNQLGVPFVIRRMRNGAQLTVRESVPPAKAKKGKK